MLLVLANGQTYLKLCKLMPILGLQLRGFRSSFWIVAYVRTLYT
jgi:hypothetical protein